MKKTFLLIALLLPTITFAGQCPDSAKAAKGWLKPKEYTKMTPDFSRFQAAVIRQNKVFCVYADANDKTKMSVLTLKGTHQVGSGPWKKDPNGKVCKKQSKCTFS